MADDVELIKGMQKNLKFTTRNDRKVGRWPRCVPFSANRVGKILIVYLWSFR